jgi:hypothetical protein
MEPHVVYVLILDGGYDGENFRGVYSTEEKAWAAHGRSGVMSRAVVAPVTLDAPAEYVDMQKEAPSLEPSCTHPSYTLWGFNAQCARCGEVAPILNHAPKWKGEGV